MKHNERGIALLTALFALLLLTGIGLGLLYMTDAETMINSNYRSSQQAYYGGMAGLQAVRERMMPINAAPHLIVPPLVTPGNPAPPASIMYVVNPTNGENVAPTVAGNAYFDTQLQNEMVAIGNNTWPMPANTFAPNIADDSPGTNTAAALNYKWVRIMAKVNGMSAPYYNNGSGANATLATPICWNGASEISAATLGVPNCTFAPGSDPPSHTQVYELTAYSVTSTGATRYSQMEVAQDPPLVTHGAVDSQDHVNLNGQLTVNGYDYCTCTCTTSGNGANQTTSCTNRVTGAIAPTCDGTHYAIYSASTVQNPNNSETLVAGTNPPVVQNQPWTWNVSQLYNQFASTPGAVSVTGPPYNYTCSGNPTTCGTQAGQTFGVPPTFPPSPADNPTGPANMSSQITVVPGNLQLTGGSIGNGILLVNGNLDIHGGLNFYGVIIVTGVISFTGGGASATNIYGAIIAGQQSYVDNTLGGSANINFDFCALPQGSKNQPPRALNLRDISF